MLLFLAAEALDLRQRLLQGSATTAAAAAAAKAAGNVRMVPGKCLNRHILAAAAAVAAAAVVVGVEKHACISNPKQPGAI